MSQAWLLDLPRYVAVGVFFSSLIPSNLAFNCGILQEWKEEIVITSAMRGERERVEHT